MRRFQQLSIAAGLLLIPAMGTAQVGFTISAGASVPDGDFAGTSGVDAGFATPGFVLIGEVGQELSRVPNLDWLVAAGVFSHGVDRLAASGEDAVEFGRYWGIPVLAGGRYRIPFNAASAVYVTAQAGVGFFRPYSVEFERQKLTRDWSTRLGFAIGGGVDVTPRIGIGVRYLPIGDTEIHLVSSEGGRLQVDQSVRLVDIFATIRVR